MFYRIRFSRRLAWRLDSGWQDVELKAFGLRAHGIWTAEEQYEEEKGLAVRSLVTTEAGWVLASSPSLVLEGERLASGSVFPAVRQLVERLRWSSGQVSIPRLPAFVEGYIDSPLKPLPEPEAIGSGYLNRIHHGAAITAEMLRTAGESREVDTPFILLADAAEASAQADHVRTILYSALAAETCSRMAIEQLVYHAVASSPADCRFLDGADDVLESLKTRAARDIDVVLHELSIYLHRRSLKREQPELWARWKRLKRARNKLAHEADFALDSNDAFGVSTRGAADALNTSIDIFEWWGLPARRFADATPAHADDLSDNGFYRP